MVKYFAGSIDDAPLYALPTNIDSNWFDNLDAAITHAVQQSENDYFSFQTVMEYRDGNAGAVVSIAFDGGTFTRD
jgi:hypothetical protein